MVRCFFIILQCKSLPSLMHALASLPLFSNVERRTGSLLPRSFNMSFPEYQSCLLFIPTPLPQERKEQLMPVSFPCVLRLSSTSPVEEPETGSGLYPGASSEEDEGRAADPPRRGTRPQDPCGRSAHQLVYCLSYLLSGRYPIILVLSGTLPWGACALKPIQQELVPMRDG